MMSMSGALASVPPSLEGVVVVVFPVESSATSTAPRGGVGELVDWDMSTGASWGAGGWREKEAGGSEMSNSLTSGGLSEGRED